MITALIGLAAAFGTDPSPAGETAVRNMLDVSAKFCAPLFTNEQGYDPVATLKAFGFAVPGSRENVNSGPDIQVSYMGSKRLDGSLTLNLRLVNGVTRECTVYSPAKVWNQFAPSMPAYVKATRLPLVQDKEFDHVWRGGGVKVSVSLTAGESGTLLGMEFE